MATETESQQQQSFLTRTFDFSDEALGGRDSRRELFGVSLFLLGVFLMAAVIFGGGAEQHIGSIGTFFHGVMTITFGSIVSFIFPLCVMATGLSLFLGKSIRWSFPKFVGMLIVIVSICCMLAVPAADTINDDLRQSSLEMSGVVGTFVTNYEGLALVSRSGKIGAFLFLTATLLTGLVLMTGLRVSALLFLDRANVPDDDEIHLEQFEGVEELPKPKKKTKPKKAESAEEEVTSDEEEIPVARDYSDSFGKKSSWFSLSAIGSAFRSIIPGRSNRSNNRGSLLANIDDSAGWTETVDEDIQAAARALEIHELETRLKKRLKVRDQRPYFDDEEPLDEDYFEDDGDGEIAEEAEYEYVYEDEPEAEYEEGFDEEAVAEEEDEEIIFNDCSGPLKSETNVGEGLAKLFPNRWPKEGTPKSAEDKENEEILASDETQDQVFDRSEERMLRQTGEGSAADQQDFLEGDPLFTAEFDTRPHGPMGETLDRPEVPSQPARPNYYRLPNVDLLTDPPEIDSAMTREEVVEMSQILMKTLADYGIDGKVTQVHQGPVVTRFEFRPAAGTKVSRIVGLEQDIAMGMKALSVRILAPIPGKNVVGIEVPNKIRQGVYVKELISHEDFWEADSPLEVAIGKTIDGKPFFADLAKMPHLLIAGATGAGKSVCLNTIICSILYRQPPDRVKLIMVDPKRVELSVYGDIPHLVAPVVCEPKRAAAALEWAVEQMEERYKKLVEFGVRNITGYNKLCENPESKKKTAGRSLEPMPYMVIVVDELADLMIVAKAEVEESIQRLAQMARAVGIHLILATQRPSVNVITGIIKANFPSRIAFQVSQKVDSRTILDTNGAESLLGKGDMLFSKGGADKPMRLQGAFLSDDEVESIAEHCREQQQVIYEVEEFEPKLSEKEQKELAKMMGVQNMGDLDDQDRIVRGTNKPMGKVTAGMFIPHDGGSASASDEEIDEALVRAAARLILESRKASVSLLQRRLKVGFARAGRLMDMLEDMGIVGPFVGSKPREIIVDPEAAIEQLDKLESALSQGVSVDEILEEENEDEDYDQ